MNRVVIVFLVSCGAWLSGVAQEPLDSASIQKLNDLAYKFFLSKPDSAIFLANKTLSAAIQGKFIYHEAHSYYILSKANWAKTNYRLSTEYGFKALRILENSPFVFEYGETLLSLARTFIDLRNLNQAQLFINRAAALEKKHSHPELIADVYRERSMLMVEQHQYDSALHTADLGIAMYKNLREPLNESILYGRKARIYFILKDYKKSMAYNRKALILDNLVGNRRALGISYMQAGQNAYQLNKIDSAILLLEKSIQINTEIGNLPSLIRCRNLLADIYQRNNKPALSIEQLRMASQHKDSLYNLEKNGQIQEMQSLYELDNKEKTIKLLEQENQLEKQTTKNQRLFNLFLLVGIFLLVLLIVVLWRLRLLQTKANHLLASKNKAIEQQKEEMQAQAESLHQLNKLKAKLFSVISHDLRGPLANLQALLELLTNNLMTPEEFVSVSDKLKAHLNVTQRTLENLLNWSLSQMEGIRTEQKNIDIKIALTEACRLLEEIARRKNVVIQNITSDPIHVLADLNQVHLIIRNLVHNAIKFSTPGSKIILSARKEGDHCRIAIQDFGIGMTKGEIEIITSAIESFTKIGTHLEKGTGLGLLLCKEFIKINGGEFQIKSNPGEGTEVSFTLPLAS